ncbi:response regulator transcription factor [Salipaludibacillus sp. HK11]|uniref:response regulator transcription factor n=1 Tax=Salipaludibacillus sp. HK11 TaxID=3394320 RepID=UPI0039FC2F9D
MNALLVDDNYQMLEYMNACIPWLEKGINVDMCESGKEAMDFAAKRKPDILITDIDMPEMNGLELIDQMHAINPNLESLIISCHDNFDYAKHALKLNVTEYILKDMLEPENFVDSLDVLISRIEERNKSKGEVEKLKSYRDQNQLRLKRELLRNVLEKSITSSDDWKQEFTTFGLHLDKYKYIPLIVKINNHAKLLEKYQSSELLMFAIDNIISEITEGREELISFTNDENEMIWFVKVKSLIKSNPYVEMKKIATHFQKVIHKYLHVDTSMVHYHQPISNLTEMKQTVSKLMNIGSHWFYVEGKKMVSTSEINQSFSQSNIFSEYTNFYEEIDKVVSTLDEDVMEEVILKWINIFTAKKYHPDEVKSLIHSVLINVSIRYQYLYQLHSDKAKVLHSQVNAISNITQIKDYMYKFMEDIIHYLGTETVTQHEEIIKAKLYVEENIDKKIRMEDASNHLYMNSSYFSRLFRKETGMTFTEYVTKTKVEKSKTYLIETDLTVEEISNKLGYENTSYYIKLFKKYYATPPMEYRKNYKFS